MHKKDVCMHAKANILLLSAFAAALAGRGDFRPTGV